MAFEQRDLDWDEGLGYGGEALQPEATTNAKVLSWQDA